MTTDTDENDIFFTRKPHIKYCLRYLNILPDVLSSQDTSRLTIAFFALSGIDVMNALDDLSNDKKTAIINWIYSLQVVPLITEADESRKRCGFQGSSALNLSCGQFDSTNLAGYRCGHLAMTYTGLASLIILGNDLSLVNKESIIEGVRVLQQEDGSFRATLSGSENDMRFVYCAACICYILDDWSGMDVEKTVQFIRNSMSYDFGIAQGPELESHGGTTFCAVATLYLMGQLHSCFTDKQLAGLKKWCIMRQVTGFQGRPNKPVDTCYSFWVGATLKMLDMFPLVDYSLNRDYILSTQDPIVGGFSKWVDTTPDPLHTYLGICGLSLMQEPDLLQIEPALNVSTRAHKHLLHLHQMWKS